MEESLKKKLLDNKRQSSILVEDIVSYGIEDIIRMLGHKSSVNLRNLAIVSWKLRNVTEYEIPLSSEDVGLKESLSYDTNPVSQQSVSKVLEKCERVGLLKCTEDTYRFGSGKYNYPKKYHVNQYVRDMILDYYFDNVENLEDKPLSEILDLYDTSTIPEEDYKQIDIVSGGLKINPLLDRRVIQKAVFEKFPLAKKVLDNVELENKRFFYDKPDLKRKFVPNAKKRDISRTKADGTKIPRVVYYSIGLRDTSEIGSLKCHFSDIEEENEWKENDITKEEYLDAYFGVGNWVEYDVKSSIWRITRWINTRVWESDDVDMYELIYGRPFEPGARDELKKMSNRLYFGTPGQIMGNINSERIKNDEPTLNIDSEVFNTALGILIKNIDNNIGPRYDSKIFVVESLLYSELALRMLYDGLDVVQIYDGFYVRKRMGLTTNEKLGIHCQYLLQDITKKWFNDVRKFLGL